MLATDWNFFVKKSLEQCQPTNFKCWNFLWKVIGTVLASVAKNCNELKVIRERCEDKNTLCMTTCGKDLQEIFKDWQRLRRLPKRTKKSIDFKQFAFWPFLTSRWPQKSYLTWSAQHNLGVTKIFNLIKKFYLSTAGP